MRLSSKRLIIRIYRESHLTVVLESGYIREDYIHLYNFISHAILSLITNIKMNINTVMIMIMRWYMILNANRLLNNSEHATSWTYICWAK